MPRVTTVKKAQKDQGSCSKCGTPIKRGDGYRHWAFRYGGRYVRCLKPECAPKASDLTQSAFLQQLASTRETLEEAVAEFERGGGAEDLATAMETAAEELRTVAEECEEKLGNMPEGLKEGDTGTLLQERTDACNEAADTLENQASEARDKEGELLDLEDPEAIQKWADENSVGVEREETDSDEDYAERLKAEAESHNNSLREEIAALAQEADLDIS
jgi:hypothetical protein